MPVSAPSVDNDLLSSLGETLLAFEHLFDTSNRGVSPVASRVRCDGWRCRVEVAGAGWRCRVPGGGAGCRVEVPGAGWRWRVPGGGGGWRGARSEAGHPARLLTFLETECSNIHVFGNRIWHFGKSRCATTVWLLETSRITETVSKNVREE